MATVKVNTEAVKKALKVRARYTLAGHEGVWLYARGDGSGSWMLRYRIAGKRRWHVLHNDAKHAVLSEVLEAKDKWLSEVKLAHKDPKVGLEAEREKAKIEGKTIEQCFEDWVSHIGRKRKRRLSKRTEEEYRRLYKLHIKPHLGTKPIAELTKKEVEAALEKVRKATSNAKKGQRGLQAVKVLKILMPLCEMAVDAELINRNPCRGIEDPVPRDNPDGRQTRTLTDDELRVVWNEAPSVMGAATVRVLRLTILLGRRISEIAGARREDARVKQEPPVLLIPASREGNKAKRDDAVPLPPAALAIIKEALSTGPSDAPLFKGAATRWTTSHAFKDFRREKNWTGRTRLHDMRGLINDQMAAMGVPTELRSRTLHHTGDLKQLANTVYSAYDFMSDRLRALALWQARLEEIVAGAKPRGLRWHETEQRVEAGRDHGTKPEGADNGAVQKTTDENEQAA